MNDRYKIECGDVLDSLSIIPSNTYHGILSDFPYGLSFMGKRWDHGVPSVEVCRKLLRVVRPGGMALVFGGTRTSHRMVCNMENAGWEIRDTLMWVYGSGFPKSYDISKGIDKAAGVERDVSDIAKLGHEEFKDRVSAAGYLGHTDGWDRPWMHDAEKANDYHLQTIPATQQAKQFAGYGTALKPSYEPIVLCMKPIEGGFAGNVIEWGSGGLNVDGCRVATNREVPSGSGNPKQGTSAFGDYTGNDGNVTANGRWPANLILSYPEDQYELAHDKVTSTQLRDLECWLVMEGLDHLGIDDTVLLEDEYGRLPDKLKGLFRAVENVGSEEVLDGFPDAGGGYATRGRGTDTNTYGGGKGYAGTLTQTGQVVGFGDSGSASRFFYCAKTSSRERHLGNINCKHPTLKPIRLTHYLAKLILPPPHVESRLLVPFSGAGSEVIGALKAGWHYVHGIEKEDEYVQYANARIKAALECDGLNWPAIERHREIVKRPFDGKNPLDYLKV